MDSGTCKHYHEHAFDSRQSLETYFSDKPDMIFGEDTLMFPIENLTNTFKDVTWLRKAEIPSETFHMGTCISDLQITDTKEIRTEQNCCVLLSMVTVTHHARLSIVKSQTACIALKSSELSGHIKGDILLDLSPGSIVHYLYASCEFFKIIIVLKVQDRCILEMKRWLDKRTGAFHWGHVTKMHAKIEGKSEQLQGKEEKVRSAVQHVMKCDLKKENIMHPMILPLADCIISFGLLEFICKNEDEYIRYLRKFSELLRPGGHLIIVGLLDTTYVTIGKDKMHIFKCNEDFISKALAGAGFVIDSCKVKKRTVVSELTDYKAMLFIAVHKKD